MKNLGRLDRNKKSEIVNQSTALEHKRGNSPLEAHNSIMSAEKEHFLKKNKLLFDSNLTSSYLLCLCPLTLGPPCILSVKHRRQTTYPAAFWSE